jgi:hypothetical protein
MAAVLQVGVQAISDISHSSRAGPLCTESLACLAKLPNVAVKLTGGSSYTDEAYSFKSLHPMYGAPDLAGSSEVATSPRCLRSWKEYATHFQEMDPSRS